MAEWSKALVLGTSPQGRGFESHRCQNNYFELGYRFKKILKGKINTYVKLNQIHINTK